jgi:hypothetical protein
MTQMIAKEDTLLSQGGCTMRTYQAAMHKHNSVAGNTKTKQAVSGRGGAASVEAT